VAGRVAAIATSNPLRHLCWNGCWWNPTADRAASRMWMLPYWRAWTQTWKPTSPLPFSIVEGNFYVRNRGLLIGSS